MSEQVIVRSVRDYWDEFVLGGLKDHKSPEDIRKAAVDAAFEEMYGLMKFRLKVDDLRLAQPTEKNQRKVENTAKEMFKKWNRLCSLCAMFRETKDILRPEDLTWEEMGRDASEEADYNEDDMGDDGFPLPDEPDGED